MTGSRTDDAVMASRYWLTDRAYEVLAQSDTDTTTQEKP